MTNSTHCPECGNLRHSLFRYAKGALAYSLYMTLPERLILGRTWRFWSDWLLPSAGDYIYDRRGYCDSNHSGAER